MTQKELEEYRMVYQQAIEANERKKLAKQSDYIGADIPPNSNPSIPPDWYLPSSGYERINPENDTPSLKPPTPPTLPMPTPDYSVSGRQASEVNVPTLTTNQAIKEAQMPPPKEGFISKLGRGAVAGLTELFKGVGMGPKNYEDYRAYKARLPYEKQAYEERMSLETAQRKGESDYDYSNRLKLVQETAKLKPIITLDQEIDNTMKYMGMLTADNKITGKKEIVDPTRYNALANQLDELLKKREIAQPAAPQSSGAIGGANAPASTGGVVTPPQAGQLTKEQLIAKGFTPQEADEYLAGNSPTFR